DRRRAQHGPRHERRRQGAGDGLRRASVRGHARRGAGASRRDCRLSGSRAVTVLLEAAGLELAYGEVAACRDLAFTVDAGEIVTLIGANGAGKSTTLRAVAGALLPRRGTIRFAGRDVTRMPSYERAGLGIALVPEGRRVFPFLTARENLELGAFKHRADKARVRTLLEKAFAMFPRLAERAAQNA